MHESILRQNFSYTDFKDMGTSIIRTAIDEGETNYTYMREGPHIFTWTPNSVWRKMVFTLCVSQRLLHTLT